MNIDDLVKLAGLLDTGTQTQTPSTMRDRYIGQYVICRSRNEGVNAGKVIALDETGVILEDARRLYYHKPVNKNGSWYEGVAKFGIDSYSKVAVAIEKVISEDYSLTVCTSDAEKSIRGAKDHEQN